MTDNETENTAQPPPLPQQVVQLGMNSPVVSFAEAKALLQEAKAELKRTMKNATPTTNWWRPAHGSRYCQYCPVNVETPLPIDMVTGVYREACDRHTYLMDAIHIARAKVRKYETMLQRIRNQEIVPRIELQSIPFQTELTMEERAHLREVGWVPKSEVIASLQTLIKDLQLGDR
tara:strand:- start:147 stop:671 length:525 start_codon:yes stop_codon:yes gene_type:complete